MLTILYPLLLYIDDSHMKLLQIPDMAMIKRDTYRVPQASNE
jgi:hypothetical protein